MGYKRKPLLALLYIVIIVFIWIIICYLKIVDSLLLPSPMQVMVTAYNMLGSGELQRQIFISLKRMFVGFFYGGISGLIVGSFCGISKKINHWVEPLVYLGYPLPRFILLPFIMLIFGAGDITKIIFIAVGSFFPVVINTISGITDINDLFLEVAKHYGAKGWGLYKRIILPGSLPSIFSALRISIGITVSSTIIIEFLTSTDGLGAMIWLSLQSLRTDRLFLGAIIVSLINILFISVLRIVQILFTPWNKEKAFLSD